MKRIFDLCVASLILLITAPIMLIIAILIRLESAGPVVYASPRVGRYGKIFGMMRFRTVDISKPSYLAMRERMTRVGRFIRNYSLDDAPNVFNLLKGDLSVVGPRATEPERVDLTDPAWQEILSVQPGLISPAILQLADRYNSSPATLKQQLEREYVQRRSFRSDLALFQQAYRGLVQSRGNWKTRGKPSIKVEYTQYQMSPTPATELAEAPPSSGWLHADPNQPDLIHAAAYVQRHAQRWENHRPQFCLVPCDGGEAKPAILFKVGGNFDQWRSTIALRHMRWPIIEDNRYICLSCVLFFEDVSGQAISVEGTRLPDGLPPHLHNRLVCSAPLDVASPEVERWFFSWQRMPGAIPFLIVSHDLKAVGAQSLTSGRHQSDELSLKRDAIRQWEETRMRLRQSGHAIENFQDEVEILRSNLPHNISWETVEGTLGASSVSESLR